MKWLDIAQEGRVPVVEDLIEEDWDYARTLPRALAEPFAETIWLGCILKSLVRCYKPWENLDEHIERIVKHAHTAAQNPDPSAVIDLCGTATLMFAVGFHGANRTPFEAVCGLQPHTTRSGEHGHHIWVHHTRAPGAGLDYSPDALWRNRARPAA